MATHSSILARRIPMDRGAWQAIVYVVTKSQTRLSNSAHTEVIQFQKPTYKERFLQTLFSTCDELCWPQERDMDFQTKLIAECG